MDKNNDVQKNSNLNLKPLTKSLEDNIALFQNIFSDDKTLITRRFQNKHLLAAKCCLIYFDSMVSAKMLNESVIEPILANDLTKAIDAGNLLDEILYKVVAADNVRIISDMDEMVTNVIYGDSILLLEGYDEAVIIDSKGWQKRAITEPESAKVVRGPREGFTESIMVNISLLRRKIKNPDLKFKIQGNREKNQDFGLRLLYRRIGTGGYIEGFRKTA